MSIKSTIDKIRSRRKFLQGGMALGAMAPLVLANQSHAHGSRLKDNKDQEFVIVSIVATHPFWNDLKAVKNNKINYFDYYGLINVGSLNSINKTCEKLELL